MTDGSLSPTKNSLLESLMIVVSAQATLTSFSRLWFRQIWFCPRTSFGTQAHFWPSTFSHPMRGTSTRSQIQRWNRNWIVAFHWQPILQSYTGKVLFCFWSLSKLFFLNNYFWSTKQGKRYLVDTHITRFRILVIIRGF